MLFLWGKGTPRDGSSDGVMNSIFRNIFPPISNPATQFAPRKGIFVIIAFNLVNENK
jgi:hypothetical protein